MTVPKEQVVAGLTTPLLSAGDRALAQEINRKNAQSTTNLSNDIEDASSTVSAEDDIENPDRPKGVRFAIVFACILMGDFFIGYVRAPVHSGTKNLY